MRKALRKISGALNVGMDRVLPDAIVLAFVLTFITFAMGLILTDSGPLDMIIYWGQGFWGFLSFSMQMAMIIAAGYIVAEAPPIKRALIKLCKIPKNGIQGVIFIGVASAILGWISWGLGLVAGAILARSVALNLRKVDFKLYVAVAYTGAITTGLFGISGSEFLLVNTPGYFLEDLSRISPQPAYRLRGGRPQRLRRSAPVPLLCRDSGHDGLVRPGGHHCQRLCDPFHRGQLPHPVLPLHGHHQFLYPLFRRHFHGGRPRSGPGGPGSGPGGKQVPHQLYRGRDDLEHHSALLGDPAFGHCRTENEGYYGLLYCVLRSPDPYLLRRLGHYVVGSGTHARTE